MTEFLYLLLGLLVGGLAGVYWANTRARGTLTGRVAQVKTQAARSTQQVVEQLRERLAQKTRELEAIQTTLEEERQGNATIHARFQHLQDQKRALGAALLGYARDSVADLAQFKELSTSLQSAIESIESRVRAMPERLAALGVRPEDEAPRGDATPGAAAVGPPASRISSGRETRGPTRPGS